MSIDSHVSGIVIVLRDEQLSNAYLPILNNSFGKTIVSKVIIKPA